MTGLAYVLRRLARDRSALLGLILVLLVVPGCHPGAGDFHASRGSLGYRVRPIA